VSKGSITNRLTGTRRPGRDRGFTLVEMLLSLTIAALLVMSVVSTTRTLTGARKGVDRRVERLTEARHAMKTIVAALCNVRRDPTRERPVIIGISGGRDGRNDSIDLLVISDHRARREGAESDQYEMSFYVGKPPDRDRPVLLCRKDHALDEYPDEGGVATVVAEGIVALSFEYYTGSDWQDEWSEFERRPPRAVRVTVAAINVDVPELETTPDATVLSTVVPIRLSKGIGSREEEPGGPKR